MRTYLRDPVHDLLLDPNAPINHVLHAPAVDGVVSGFLEGSNAHVVRVWNLLALAGWYDARDTSVGGLAMQDEPYLLATLERSTRTGVHVAGLRIATYALVFISSVLVARVLGPEGRGRYALPIAVLAIVLALGNLGLEHAQIYLAGKGVPLTTLWANSSLVGAGVAIVTWVLAAVLIAMPAGIPGDTIPTAWLLLALVQVPILLHVLYWLNLLQLAGHVRVGVAIGMVVATLQVASVGIVIRADALTPFAFLVIIGLMNLLTWAITLGMGVRLGLASRRIDRSVLAEGLRFGLRAQLGIMFVFLLFRVDQILVERFLGFHELGLYTLAVTLAELLWLASDPFAASLLPHQVAARGDDDVRLGYAAARLSLLMICAGDGDRVDRGSGLHPPDVRSRVRRLGMAVQAAAPGGGGAVDPATARRRPAEAWSRRVGQCLRRVRPRRQRGRERAPAPGHRCGRRVDQFVDRLHRARIGVRDRDPPSLGRGSSPTGPRDRRRTRSFGGPCAPR